jgi:hypothetical protein
MPRQEQQRLIIEARLSENFLELCRDVGAVGVRAKQRQIAIAGEELDRAILI